MSATPKKKKRGRPIGYRADNPADKTIPKVRVTQEQLDAYKQASEASGNNFSQWVRITLDNAAKKSPRKRE